MHPFSWIAILALGLFCWSCSHETPPQPLPQPVQFNSAEQAKHIHSTDSFDEGKASYFMLPNPLVLANGQPVQDAKTWYDQRRPEILKLFEMNVYGRAPGRPEGESFEVFESNAPAFSGKAIRRQVTIHFAGRKEGLDILMYLPANPSKPVPLFLCLSFQPLQLVMDDPAIRLQDSWDREHVRHPGSKRAQSPAFEIDQVLDHGFGIAVIYYCQIEPDFAGGLPYGVRSMYLPAGHSDVQPDEWGSVAAWAWGASRAMDYLQTDPQVDARHIAIMGHSRLGKTAMWTGASDTRFAMVIACSSGRGGASLSRRNFGETVANLTKKYGYQFCANYRGYANHIADLPVDSHELLGLIAPRPVYLATASLDLHSDPMGEFQAAVAAGPIYQLLGASGLGVDGMPSLDVPIMHDIAFHCHTGKHEVTPFDWQQILKFADMKLKPSEQQQ
jgi:hypothetical protein